ncbi:hypothetical protein EJB05_17336, partial [Eragrostis curvula]
MRLVLLRTRLERKERLPSCGAIVPWSGTLLNWRPVTRFPRRSQETPTHEQNDSVAVQLPARTPWGSLSCALKASSASRSVVLDGEVSALAYVISEKTRSIIWMHKNAMVVVLVKNWGSMEYGENHGVCFSAGFNRVLDVHNGKSRGLKEQLKPAKDSLMEAMYMRGSMVKQGCGLVTV